MLLHLELNTGGFYHALDTVLERLDKLQAHFLRQLGLTDEEAFLEFNLVPLSTHRDIGMLGLIFRCVHELAHKDLQQLFPRAIAISNSYETKYQAHRHTLQLKEHREGTKHALLRRAYSD